MSNSMKNVAKRFGVLSEAGKRSKKLGDLSASSKATKVKGGRKKMGDAHGCPACPHPGAPSFHSV